MFAAAIAAGALSVDALKGSAKPFDPRISELRGQPGQIRVAAAIAGLLEGSEILTSHVKCSRVQDPYSFRCQPQVMGACLDLLQNAARTLTIEAGAVTDNPIVFADEDTAISGGNFHAQPVAFAADTIAIALCEVGSISERRVSVLVDPKMSGLPAFLTEDSGVNSGLMIPQVTAAALVSENKSLAFPASVDSIPTSAGQEDHVSMAPIAARKAAQIARNAAGVIAVELMAGAEGIDYHAPLKTSREASGDPRGGPRSFAALHCRSLLGRRDERAPGRGAGGRDRRRGRRAQLTRVQRCSLQNRPHDGAAFDDHHVLADLAHGCRAADVALRLERATLVDAVARGAEVAQHPGPRRRPFVAVVARSPSRRCRNRPRRSA